MTQTANEKLHDPRKFSPTQVWSYGTGISKVFVPNALRKDFERWAKNEKIKVDEGATYTFDNKNKKTAEERAFIEGKDYIFSTDYREDVTKYLKQAYKDIKSKEKKI